MFSTSCMPGLPMRKPKDKDFVRTEEGLYFCLVGYLHPFDKYTAYLHYAPLLPDSRPELPQDKEHFSSGPETPLPISPLLDQNYGQVERRGRRYNKGLVTHTPLDLVRSMAYLKCYFPHYLGYCPLQDIHFCFVPQEKISRYYCPETRLAEILAFPGDSLEEEIAKFASHLMETTRITRGDLGITGSVLLGIHDPHLSDIDLMVYGLENALRIREILSYGQTPQADQTTGAGRDFGTLQGAGVRPEGEERRKSWRLEKVRNFGLSLEEALYLASRRWNHGFFSSRYFSIRPVRKDAEIREDYGDHSYRNVGRAVIQATISSSQESLFLPARYEVEDVKVLELKMQSEEKVPSCMPAGEVTLSPGEKPREQFEDEFLKEIVSYVELYCDAFEANDRILARGKLEKVDGQYYRLVIGSAEGENIEYVKREHT